ncbi:putative methylthioribulose-1-phosphate dehydratase [Apostichopus japonicus]|uniref:Putative methylthioribulose-1-phosphate dehydratase n=1 Tax=Stichopus japonicus TaxID=307972 RepID=A0A2G8L463_STIJA|nr:putative methylthioribulose-1-phosphate dehydratase [Apostichopus japonicus]
MSSNNVYDKEHPRHLIPELCRLFYDLGWMTGSGGALSIKEGNEIYVTPSGVQKERIQPDDLFVTNLNGDELDGPPKEKKLRRSQCARLMMTAYQKRDPGAVFHTHSPSATFISILYPGNEFRITHQQMIRGVGGRYDEELAVPIIQNAHDETKTIAKMEKALDDYPNTNAVIVRRQKVKLRCESYDYLFETAIKMKQFGLDPAEVPKGEEVAPS